MGANVKWPRSPNMRLGRRASATPAELLKPALVRRGSWSPNFRLTRRSSDSSAIINDKVSKVFLDWKRVHNNSAILSLLFWWISISCAVLCDCFPPRKAPPTRASLFRLVRRKGMSQLFVDINVFLKNKKTWTDFFFFQSNGRKTERSGFPSSDHGAILSDRMSSAANTWVKKGSLICANKHRTLLLA